MKMPADLIMERCKAVVLCFCLACGVLNGAGAAEEDGGWVEGQRLLLSGGKCSISAPGAGWKWYQGAALASGNETYCCHHVESDERIGMTVTCRTLRPAFTNGQEFFPGREIFSEVGPIFSKAPAPGRAGLRGMDRSV